MIVLYQRKFLKDLALVPLQQRKKIEHFVLMNCLHLKIFSRLTVLKK